MGLITSTGTIHSNKGAIVRTSGGTWYAVFGNSSNGLEVWKNLDGTPSQVYVGTGTDVHGGGTVGGIHAAIDSSDKIHLIAAADSGGQTRDVAYRVLDTSDDSWDAAWALVQSYSESGTYSAGSHITLDGSSYPHVLYLDRSKISGSTQPRVRYTYWTGSAWSSPEQVSLDDNKADAYNAPRMSHAPNGDLEAVYWFVTDTDVAYNRRNGSWGTESVYSESQSWLSPDVVVASGDVTYRYHQDVGESVDENDSSTGYYCYNRQIRATLVNDVRYVFYVDTSYDVHLISNDGGGWTDEGALVAESLAYDDPVIPEYSYSIQPSGSIGFLYGDSIGGVYFGEFVLSATPEPSVADSVSVSDTPTVRVSAPQVSVADSVDVSDTPTVSGLGPEDRTVTVADTATTTDTPTVRITIATAVADAVGVADTATVALGTLTAIVSDVAATTDTAAAQILLATATSDTVGVSDAPSLYLNILASIADAVGVSDVATAALSNLLAALTDAASVTDTPTVRVVLLVSVTDTVSISDTPTVELSAGTAQVADSVTVSDSVTAWLLLATSVADATSVTDTPIVAVGAEPDREISVSDGVAVADSVVTWLQVAVLVSDAASAGDAPSVELSAGVAAVSDTVTVVDSPTVAVPVLAVVSDTVNVSDAPAAWLGLAASVSDAVSISDTPSAEVLTEPRSVTVADTVATSDSVAAYLELSRAVSDTIAAADSVVIALSVLEAAVSDAVSLADTPTVSVEVLAPREVTVADSVNVADSVMGSLLLARLLGDSVTLAEAVVVAIPVLPVSVSDATAVTDVPVVSIGALPPSQVEVADSVTVADSPTVVIVALEVVVTDTATVSDSLTMLLNLTVVLVDVASVSEDVVMGSPEADARAIAVSDAVSLIDSPAASLALPVLVADAVSVAELIVSQASLAAINVADAVTVSDIPVALITRDLFLLVSDSVLLTEALMCAIVSMKLDVDCSDSEIGSVTIEDVLIGRLSWIADWKVG